MERALIINNLTKAYHREPVLRGLHLEVLKGRIFGLIGPNGAGKSTLIGVLTGILPFDEGQIFMNGLELLPENEQAIKKRVASVLQPPLVFENFTSLEFTRYVCQMYGTHADGLDEKIGSLFSYFEIDGYRDVKVKQLSSGSRKKLAFSTAILTRPDILFLDEPFESVDVISISRMKGVLRKLKENGVSIFITSHILEVVESLCDDIAILHHGKIVARLDSSNKDQLQKDATLSEIFEETVGTESGPHLKLDWL